MQVINEQIQSRHSLPAPRTSLIHCTKLSIGQALAADKIVPAQPQQLMPSSNSSWPLTRSRTVCNAFSRPRRALHTRLGDLAFRLPSLLTKHKSSDPIQDFVASTIA